MDVVEHARELAAGAVRRSRHLLVLLDRVDRVELEAPSELPGWSRLTIVCHLRYGLRALVRMTGDSLAGRETSYYPDGRAAQRPITLRPSPGESAGDVLEDFRSAAEELDRVWSQVSDERWKSEVAEPADNPDLGSVPLAWLALAGLTELDVHGTDLNIGAPDWSPTLVRVGLPARIGWLSARRANHRAFDTSMSGSWRLEATEGPSWLVAVDAEQVTARAATGADEATAVISGSGRDLLALLLGRPRRREQHLEGDVTFAQAFGRAFPGP